MNHYEPPLKPTWWNRNKGIVLGSIATIAVATAITQKVVLVRHNKFLLDKGLLNEFHTKKK